jgi:hypothetical protein
VVAVQGFQVEIELAQLFRREAGGFEFDVHRMSWKLSDD